MKAVACIFLLIFSCYSLAQCEITSPVDGTDDTSSNSCSFTAGGLNTTTEKITLQNGASLTINYGRWRISGDTVFVENGATLTITTTGNFALTNDAALVVRSGGLVVMNVGGNIQIGRPDGSAHGGIHVDGSITVNTGTININSSSSTLTGTGTVTYSGTINTSNGASSDMGCTSGTCTCSSCDTPLPVELTSFEGHANGTGIELKWVTATELNNQGFWVEKSIDGLVFDSIGFVDGAGNSTDEIIYRFSDVSSSNCYYRLLQVDYDGAYEYSPTIFVQVNSILNIQVYPNPFVEHVSFLSSGNDKYEVLLSDAKGRALLKAQGFLDSIEQEVNSKLGAKGAGIYYLLLRNPEEQRRFTLVKR